MNYPLGDIIDKFMQDMAKLDVKIMEIHLHNLDRLKLHFIAENNPNTRMAAGNKDFFYGRNDMDTLRFVNKDWWFEYCYNLNMPRKNYFAWRPAYKNLLKFDNPIAAEIGVLEGFNALLAYSFIDFGKYYLIDPYKEYPTKDLGSLDRIKQPQWDNFYEKVKERFANYKNVELIRKTSEEASRDFANENLDFVYIDGDHTKEGVKKDLHSWFPKVKKGGYLAGHDVDNVDVKSAIYEFYLEIYGSDITRDFVDNTIETEFNDWWIKKV